MPYIERRPEFNNAPTPAWEVSHALRAAEYGQMPSFDEEHLLTSLHLEGDEPDGLALMERFTARRMTFNTLRDIPTLMERTSQLLGQANAHTTNEAQEMLAHMLGQVITRQVTREGDICPGAREIALECAREDIISTDVKAKLGIEAHPSNLRTEDFDPEIAPELLNDLLRSMFDRGGNIELPENVFFAPHIFVDVFIAGDYNSISSSDQSSGNVQTNDQTSTQTPIQKCIQKICPPKTPNITN